MLTSAVVERASELSGRIALAVAVTDGFVLARGDTWTVVTATERTRVHRTVRQ